MFLQYRKRKEKLYIIYRKCETKRKEKKRKEKKRKKERRKERKKESKKERKKERKKGIYKFYDLKEMRNRLTRLEFFSKTFDAFGNVVVLAIEKRKEKII